jgi:hypothetical protein
VPEHGPLHRYRGQYMANNRLKIVGDVISADATSFPIAFRFSTETLSSTPVSSPRVEEEQEGKEEETKTVTSSTHDDHLAFVIKIYRLPSRTLVRELSGRNLAQHYLLDKDQLVDSSEEEEGEGGGGHTGGGGKDKDKKDSSGKKDKKKGGKGGEEVPSDALEFLLEVVVDDTRMIIPAAWKSRYPYRFHQADGSTVPESAVSALERSEVAASFTWQLDILAGKVYQLRHDTFDLEHFAAVKNEWEEASHGREERAAAALAYVTALRGKHGAVAMADTEADDGSEEKKEKEKEKGKGKEEGKKKGKDKDVTDGPVNLPFLCEALEKESADVTMTDRENILQFIPTAKEHVVVLGEGQSAVEVDPSLVSREKEQEQQDASLAEQATEEALAALMAFNDKMRGLSLERIGTIRAQVKSNFEESIENWSQRNSYKESVEVRNATLQFLLERSAEAKEKVFTPEEEEMDAKKGGGGKGKPAKGKDKKKK